MDSLKTRVILSGLILALVSACNGSKPTRHPDYPVERFWEPLLQNCIKGDSNVTCKLVPFRTAINASHKCWEVAGNLGMDVKECEGRARVDKKELQSKVFGLQVELDKWWRLPLVWAGLGILAGFSIGFGIQGL